MDIVLGTVCAFGFNFAPYGWYLCQGQIISISQNSALFALLGTNYGGNGTSTFGLPDLQGKAAICYGQGPGLQDYVLGEYGGTTSHNMISTEMPAHNHTLTLVMNIDDSGNIGDTNSPVNAYLSYDQGDCYSSTVPPAGQYLHVNGGNQLYTDVTGNGAAFSIQAPYLTMNYSIAMNGIFPQRP